MVVISGFETSLRVSDIAFLITGVFSFSRSLDKQRSRLDIYPIAGRNLSVGSCILWRCWFLVECALR